MSAIKRDNAMKILLIKLNTGVTTLFDTIFKSVKISLFIFEIFNFVNSIQFLKM